MKNWQKTFLDNGTELLGIDCSALISTVSSLLEQQKAEIVEQVKVLIKQPTLCGNCNFAGELCKECYANRRANSTLSDVLALLTHPIEQK